MVSSWIERWAVDHEKPPMERYRQSNDPTMSPTAVLEERTRRLGRVVSRSVINHLCGGQMKRVAFYEVADPLACAMGFPEVFTDGTLPVLGDEQISLEEVAA